MSAKKKTAKKTGMRARGKAAPSEPKAFIIAAIQAAAVRKISASGRSFFDNHDNAQAPLTAPGVYREDGGSRTTILLCIGRTRCYHVPMDATGLAVVKTPVKAFLGTWVSVPYTAKAAAVKYLETSKYFIPLHPRAKAALDAIIAGGNEAAVKRALDHVLPDDAPPAIGGLADGLRAAAKANGKTKRGGNLPKGRGIGAWVCEQLIAKVPDAKLLKAVQVKFPGAKTNASHLNWYRNKLKREGALS